MDLFQICAAVITLSALFGYINVRFLRLPNTIGLMIVAIVCTGLLFASSYFSPWLIDHARDLIKTIPFADVVLNVMLGFLLFAGAMHTNFDQLRVQRWPVLVFATVGVLVSTFLIGTIVYYVFGALSLEVRYIHCLLFGSLISPTDPIAVLGILKQARVPKKLETKIVGESLFNDGVGVVVFLTLFSIATGGQKPHGHVPVHEPAEHVSIESPAHAPAHASVFTLASTATSDSDSETHENESASEGIDVAKIAELFGVEVLGGIALGLVLGFGTYWLLRSIDDYEIEVMITLACVVGGMALATMWHLSGPLAMVVAGLIVGNDTVRNTAMSRQTETYVDKFWELLDILLNAVLFVLIGLELLIVEIHTEYWLATGLTILIVLGSRFVSLILPVRFFAKRLDFVPHTTTIMTWGGLRGGISIALALMLPEECRNIFLCVTYGVVIFSIIVQGLTVGPLARRLIGIDDTTTADTVVTH